MQNVTTEDLWQQSMLQTTNGEHTVMTNGQISSWMNILFLGIFVAIPYLIHKILNNIRQTEIKGNYLFLLHLYMKLINEYIFFQIIIQIKIYI